MKLVLTIPKALVRNVDEVRKLLNSIRVEMLYDEHASHFTVHGEAQNIYDLRNELLAYLRSDRTLPEPRLDSGLVLSAVPCGRLGFSFILRERDVTQADVALTHDAGILYIVGTRISVEKFIGAEGILGSKIDYQEALASILELN